MKVAVTGAAGHVGAVICRELIQQGHEVVALIHRNIKPIEGLPLTTVKGGLLERESLEILTRGCDTLIHAAGKIGLSYRHDRSVYDVNLTGTKLLFETAEKMGIKRIVYFSSIQVFNPFPLASTLDENRGFINNDAVYYDRIKRDAHISAMELATDGQDIVILCPTSIVGPPDFYPSKLGKAIIDIYNGNIPAVVKGGFNFVDVRDVAKASVTALHSGRRGETYILGGKYYTIQEFGNLIYEIKGSKKRLKELPLFMASLGLPFVKAYAYLARKGPLYDKVYLDILQRGNKNILSGKAERELDFSARSLYETLSDSIKWFQDTGKI